jgi:quercetin dioxygenase-like cupin family protein
MNEEQFRGELARDGFPAPVLVERDSTYALDAHQHPFEAFALIIEGEITIEVNGVKTEYRQGQTFRLPPDVPHREFAGPQGVRYLSGRKEKA